MDLEPVADKILICVDCNEEFVFTVAAQQYFLERGITEEPKRCKSCYMALKKERRQQQKDDHQRPSRRFAYASGNGNYRGSNNNGHKKENGS